MDEIPVKLRCAACNRLAVNAFRMPCCDQSICEDCRYKTTLMPITVILNLSKAKPRSPKHALSAYMNLSRQTTANQTKPCGLQSRCFFERRAWNAMQCGRKKSLRSCRLLRQHPRWRRPQTMYYLPHQPLHSSMAATQPILALKTRKMSLDLTLKVQPQASSQKCSIPPRRLKWTFHGLRLR